MSSYNCHVTANKNIWLLGYLEDSFLTDLNFPRSRSAKVLLVPEKGLSDIESEDDDLGLSLLSDIVTVWVTMGGFSICAAWMEE